MVTLDFALETVMQLPIEEREDLLEILKKRQSHDWRKETADYYYELKKEINDGKIKSVSVDEALKELHELKKIEYSNSFKRAKNDSEIIGMCF